MILKLPSTMYYLLRRAAYGTPVSWIARRIRNRGGRKASHQTAAFWNDELSGRMSTPNLNGRISNALRDTTTVVVAEQCGVRPERVLDVGCGFGDLVHEVAKRGMRRYVGVDLSDFVTARANRQRAGWGGAGQCEISFHTADLREYTPEEGSFFDMIVFNEVLKYVEVTEAAAQVGRYGRWLAPGGVLCINLSSDPKCSAIFRALERELTWVYGVVYQQRPEGPKHRLTSNRATPAYLLGLFRPRTALRQAA